MVFIWYLYGVYMVFTSYQKRRIYNFWTYNHLWRIYDFHSSYIHFLIAHLARI